VVPLPSEVCEWYRIRAFLEAGKAKEILLLDNGRLGLRAPSSTTGCQDDVVDVANDIMAGILGVTRLG